MNIHKNARLTPLRREEIDRDVAGRPSFQGPRGADIPGPLKSKVI